jgi:hypothetical protein
MGRSNFYFTLSLVYLETAVSVHLCGLCGLKLRPAFRCAEP